MELDVRILITGGTFQLSQKLAAALAGAHDIVLTARSELTVETPGYEFVRSDLGHDDATNDLVRGMDVIIHSGESDQNAGESDRLDVAMRCTYNLLMAAAEEGVPGVVYLSSLRILDKYDEDMTVTERWRPVPTTELSDLCYHLSEFVCREFGRERKASVVCLRLGDLVRDGGEPGGVASSALYFDDAVRAVEKALTVGKRGPGPARAQALGGPGWNIFHIQSSVPKARFKTGAARDHLGYEPEPCR